MEFEADCLEIEFNFLTILVNRVPIEHHEQRLSNIEVPNAQKYGEKKLDCSFHQPEGERSIQPIRPYNFTSRGHQ